MQITNKKLTKVKKPNNNLEVEKWRSLQPVSTSYSDTEWSILRQVKEKFLTLISLTLIF